jgi:hypothetical protein
VTLDELVEVVQDLPLALGERHHAPRIIRKGKAKVKLAKAGANEETARWETGR